jgi:hypothetical protein
VKESGAKGRTERERSDPVENIVTANVGRRGNDERLHGGKCGTVSESIINDEVLFPANL